MAKQELPMTREEKALNDIHEVALNEDHMLVPFKKDDQLTMANAVIKKMQEKLYHIAELAQIGLGD